MLQVLRHKYRIDACDIDFTEHLCYNSIFKIFQELWTDFNSCNGKDNFNIRDDYGAFWIVTRYMANIYELPKYHDFIDAEIWVVDRQNLRLLLGIQAKMEDRIFFEGKIEACALSLIDQSICTLDEIEYPLASEIVSIQPDYKCGRFTRIMKDTTAEDFIYQRKIRACDIDMSRHTNNLAYLPILLNAKPTSFYLHNPLKYIEIHYILQSHEGDDLNIAVYDDHAGNMVFSAKNSEGKYVTKIIAKY